MLFKSLAALLLGMPLAVALVGVAVLASGGGAAITLPLLLLFFPVWIGVMACAFLCRSGARAWLWLGGATVAGFAVIHLLKAAILPWAPA